MELVSKVKSQATSIAEVVKARVQKAGETAKSTKELVTTRSQEISKATVSTSTEVAQIVSASAKKLGQAQLAAVKGGYAAVLDQLKLFKDVRGLKSLKSVLETQIKWAPEAGKGYVSSVKDRVGIITDASEQISARVKAAFKAEVA